MKSKAIDFVNRRGFLKHSVATGVALGIGTAAAPTAPSDNSDRRHIGSEPQLFLDDWIIERMAGLKRVLHQPQKKGLLKNADGSNWERGDVYLGNIVCRDGKGRFQMTYRYFWHDPEVRKLHPSIGEDKAHWFRESVAYATSDDGIHWTKPKLGLVSGPTGFQKKDDHDVPTGMSKDNNLGVPFDFIYDLHAHGNITDPAKRFLLRVVKKDDTHPFPRVLESQLCYAEEWPDFAGDPKWKEKLTPIPGGQLSPRGFRSIAGYDQQAKLWFAVCQDVIGRWKPRGGRDIARYTTPDFVKWSGPELVLPIAADESKDAKDTLEYMMLDAYRIGGTKTGAWLGQLTIFHSDRSNRQYEAPGMPDVWRKGTTELRLVLSRDAGKTWQRVGGKQVWLPYHPKEHGYDRLAFGQYPVRVGDELWLYYSA